MRMLSLTLLSTKKEKGRPPFTGDGLCIHEVFAKVWPSPGGTRYDEPANGDDYYYSDRDNERDGGAAADEAWSFAGQGAVDRTRLQVAFHCLRGDCAGRPLYQRTGGNGQVNSFYEVAMSLRDCRVEPIGPATDPPR